MAGRASAPPRAAPARGGALAVRPPAGGPGGPGRSKADEVAAALRELIVLGEIRPGAPLRQRHLAERFGVSSTPVREALRRLESEGLVRTDVNRGSSVVEVDVGAVEERYQIRAVLEALAVRLAAAKVTAADLREAHAIHLELAACAGDDPRVHTLDRRLHLRVCECAGSPLLMSMLRLLWRPFPGGPRVPRPHAESTAQHAAILEALAAGDPAAAGARTSDHVLHALGWLRR